MACAAKVIASMMNATARPVATPIAASASIQPATCIMLSGTGSSTGQREYIPNVRTMESVILAALGPASNPGSGRNTNTPEMRASTSRNPYNKDAGMAGLACITRKVAEHSDRIRRKLLEHPRHQKKKAKQERRQPWNGAERRVLH